MPDSVEYFGTMPAALRSRMDFVDREMVREERPSANRVARIWRTPFTGAGRNDSQPTRPDARVKQGSKA